MKECLSITTEMLNVKSFGFKLQIESSRTWRVLFKSNLTPSLHEQKCSTDNFISVTKGCPKKIIHVHWSIRLFFVVPIYRNIILTSNVINHNITKLTIQRTCFQKLAIILMPVYVYLCLIIIHYFFQSVQKL